MAVRVAPSLLAALLMISVPMAATAQSSQDRPPAEAMQLPRELSAYPGMDRVQLQYDRVRIEGTTFRLSGDVDLIDSEHGVRLLADELSFDIEAFTFEASGNVSFEQGELLLNGTTMSGDLDEGTMRMEDAKGVAPGPFYVRAELVEQIEPGKFSVRHGIISPCNQTTAIWEFRSGNMTFQPGKNVTMSWPHIRVKGLPILGLPYVYWPLKDSQRQTGFLLPSIGSSNRKGFMISQPFFWAISRSTDLTLTYEHFGKAGSGFASEFRHSLAESSNGFIRSYYLPGRQLTPEEEAAGGISFPNGYVVSAAHVQSLPAGFTLRAGADFISSPEFVQAFSDNIDRFFSRQSVVSADLTKTWGSNTLSLVIDHRENYRNSTFSTVGRRLPQLKYQLRSTQLFGPVYLGLQASAARLDKRERERDDDEVVDNGGAYQRFDAFPDLAVQITQIPWLTFNPFFQWRATHWSHREGPREDGTIVDEPLLRNFYETGMEIVGPSFYKIFETPASEYSPRLKHLVQPRLIYRRVNQLDTEFLRRIIQFDEVDSGRADSETLQASVTTRLFSKRYLSPQDDQRQVWQSAEVTVGRDFDLTPLSPNLEEIGVPRVLLPYFVSGLLQPTNRLYLRADMRFTPAFTPANFNLSTTVNTGSGNLGISWFRGVRTRLDPVDLSQVLVETSTSSLRANGSLTTFGGAIGLSAAIEMDLLRNELLSTNAAVKWNLQCCSIGLDVRRFNFAARQETQFSFVLELAQVGSLGFDNQGR